ncbi:putative c6 zinc finger domain protein [Phaeomoniella chlamydospora]|uniref:Putative c6 zinc finger domain protein n=1 Tax=Phaeomoniella chlamydospora TaxID=158046 RepID=A0A0G2EB07_PHACM|nr:putative c6 zinc finger domain protein [Phaeomoniella chlamydospora]
MQNSKADLIRENDRLRHQLGGARETSCATTPSLDEPNPQGGVSGSQDLENPTPPRSSTIDQAYVANSINPDVTGITTTVRTGMSQLDNQDVNYQEISDCFALFFNHYERFVSDIFERNMSPPQYFEESPFLFWAIVCTGARKHPKDPSLLERASKILMGLALKSLYSMEDPIPSIKAVLLLLLWPLPMTTTYKDPSFAFSGAAMQLAIQGGLHVAGHAQDYSQTKHRFSESEQNARSRLWIQCVIAMQRFTNLVGGLPFWTLPGIPDPYEKWNLASFMAPELLHRFKLHQLLISAINTLNHALEIDRGNPPPSFYSLIEMHDLHIEQALPPDASAINKLFQTCMRLGVREYHFFATHDEANLSGLVVTFTLACKLLEEATALDQSQDLALFSPIFIARMITLAAFSVLKITKGPLKSHIDLHTAEEAIYKAITFSRRRSLQQHDIDSRNSTILNQLWFSQSAFKGCNGMDESLRLYCRTRQFMSVVYDCCWWWRIEFGGPKYRSDESGPVALSTNESEITNPQNAAAGDTRPMAAQQLVGHPPMNIVNQQFQDIGFDTFPDWEWSAGLMYPNDMTMSLPTLIIQ